MTPARPNGPNGQQGGHQYDQPPPPRHLPPDQRSNGSNVLASPSNPAPKVLFKEKWAEKSERIRRTSPAGHMPGWRLLPVIIKSNDDLRQEAFAAQLIQAMARILRAAFGDSIWIKDYAIVATDAEAGVIEAVPDTVSIDALKRNDPHYTNLDDFFHRYFKGPDPADAGSSAKPTPTLNEAKMNFVRSLAPYCMICYLLNLKDRHNGNILLDAWGHICHIDFGFLFMSSPGGNLNFESAPFKLTDEMVELMGGPRSHLFNRFRELCVKTFLELRRHAHQVTLLVDMMAHDGHSDLPCWQGRSHEAAELFRQRFRPDLSEGAAISYVHSLIDAATGNWRTRWYDKYQRCALGIF